MLIHCLSSLSGCSCIFQRGYSLWHTNAARPWLAETKIPTFSTLLWPCQLKATSRFVNKAQHSFLLPNPTRSPWSTGSGDSPAPARAGTALRAGCRAKHLFFFFFSPPYQTLPMFHFLPAHRPVSAQTSETETLEGRYGAASSKAADLCPAPCSTMPSTQKNPPQEPFCVSGNTTGPNWAYRTLRKRTKTMGIALFCMYPLCSSAIKPLQLPQPPSSRQDRRWLFPSPSFPAVPGQATLSSTHGNESPTRGLGLPRKELRVSPIQPFQRRALKISKLPLLNKLPKQNHSAKLFFPPCPFY